MVVRCHFYGDLSQKGEMRLACDHLALNKVMLNKSNEVQSFTECAFGLDLRILSQACGYEDVPVEMLKCSYAVCVCVWGVPYLRYLFT